MNKIQNLKGQVSLHLPLLVLYFFICVFFFFPIVHLLLSMNFILDF